MIKVIFIYIIKIYKLILSPILGPSCRYLPSCSNYFIDCLNEHGVMKGTLKGFGRILSCHPVKFLGGGEGYDPVRKDKN